MERMIYYSTFAISCHSGFLVQISGANNSKIIDIINKKDFSGIVVGFQRILFINLYLSLTIMKVLK